MCYDMGMKQFWYIFGIGGLVFLLPFLGVPSALSAIVLALSGLVLMVISLFNIRQYYLDSHNNERKDSPTTK